MLFPSLLRPHSWLLLPLPPRLLLPVLLLPRCWFSLGVLTARTAWSSSLRYWTPSPISLRPTRSREEMSLILKRCNSSSLHRGRDTSQCVLAAGPLTALPAHLPRTLNSAVGWQDQTSERSIQLLCEAFEVSAVQCIPPQRDPSVEGSTSSWVHAAKVARALPMTLPGRFHNILFHNICVVFGPPHRS